MIADILRRFDAFPKIEALYLKQTSTGAIATILTYSLMTLLFVAEIFAFQRVSSRHTFRVDGQVKDIMPVSIDISVGTECEKLAVVNYNNQGQISILNDRFAMEDIDFETVMEGKQSLNGGCRVRGSTIISKLDGKLAFIPLPTIEYGALGEFLSSLDEAINFSHVIHQLNFGPAFPGAPNPLQGTIQAAVSLHENFSYHVSIIPTTHRANSRIIDTNQYALTGVQGKSGKEVVDKPGVFITYKMEALRVRIENEHQHWLHFIVHLLGILGGVYISTGLITSLFKKRSSKLPEITDKV